MTVNPHSRLRHAVFLVSLAMVALQLGIVRELAWRFWEHVAWLVISMGMLGFGASGTMLVILHRVFPRLGVSTLATRDMPVPPSRIPFLLLLANALSVPIVLLLTDRLQIDLIQMVWQPGRLWTIAVMELLFMTPFLFGGAFIGLSLEDSPAYVPGHYAASFIGSAIGGALAMACMLVITPRMMMLACGALIIFAAMIAARTRLQRLVGFLAAPLFFVLLAPLDTAAPISPDKDLPQIMSVEGARVVAEVQTPMGHMHLIESPSSHSAPGLSLGYTGQLPEHQLLLVDGQVHGRVYGQIPRDSWAFMDFTGQGLPYRLTSVRSALVMEHPGGENAGLAKLHGCPDVAVVHGNPYLDQLYDVTAPDVQVGLLRGYLEQTGKRFDLIQLPIVGADRGGLRGAEPSSVFTVETFSLCLSRLSNKGVLSSTTWIQTPPRESLRILDTTAAALRADGKAPRDHIVAIRNWATLTVLVLQNPVTDMQAAQVRRFCEERQFDLVWLRTLEPAEINRHHRFKTPVYHSAAAKILNGDVNWRDNYVYKVAAATDNRPFFHHFGRWRSLLSKQHVKSHTELSIVFLLAALIQASVLAALLIPLPLLPAIGLPREASGHRLSTLVYFAAIGGGFMLLEIGHIQHLSVYLGHPVLAAAVVIAAFLLFAGIGSIVCAGFTNEHAPQRVVLVLVSLGVFILLGTPAVLAATTRFETLPRVLTAIAIIAPLALPMGMMLPLGMKHLGERTPSLIPWAWSVNGFTSVLATLLAPLLALEFGFLAVGGLALALYACAGLAALSAGRAADIVGTPRCDGRER